jgi:hypothetical protein
VSDPAPAKGETPEAAAGEAAEEASAGPSSALPAMSPFVQRLRRPALALLTFGWLPLVASGLAVVLSLASIYVSTREPEVVAILPDVVRLVGGTQSGASYVYLQPAFVSTGVNDRVEVIGDMRLVVQRSGGDEPPIEMGWASQAALETDANGVLSYRYEADAVPLLVGPRSAASPLSLFQAPAGWFFGEGTYSFTLEAERVVVGTPLTATFEVTIDADDLDQLMSPGPDRFLAFEIGDES